MSSRKMFGEYAVYHYDKIVALVCDNRLYVKPTDAGKAFLGKGDLAAPYPGAALHIVVEDLDDAQRLCELVKITAKALPEPKKKAQK